MECSRRFFIESIGAFTTVTLVGCKAVKSDESPAVRFGFVTDCHYAEIPYARRAYPVGDAAYSESADKLAECVAVMNRERPDFLIELGDFKDLGSDKAATAGFLDRIEGVFGGFRGARYHVLGNHDFDALEKEEFLSRISNAGQAKALPHYSFAVGSVKFVVLDACYNSKLESYRPGNWVWSDANVPPEQLDWLSGELAAAKGPVVVFCHQCLCPAAEPKHIVKNAAEVRTVLEDSGKVKAVFTGHQHSGLVDKVKGITYYSLRGLVLNSGEEENSYALAEVFPSGGIRVTGYRKAVSTTVAAN